MSTRDPSAATPEELRLVEQQLPRPRETPTASAPTPGLAGAATRVPLGPTLPDFDPTSLAAAMARAANELFVVSPPSSPTTSIAPQLPAVSAPPSAMLPNAPMSAPATPTMPSSIPVDATRAAPSMPATTYEGSPFAAPISFDAVSLDRVGDVGLPSFDAIPIIDTPIDGGEAITDAPAPYWMAPTTSEARPSTPSMHAFQIDPITDLAVRSPTGNGLDPYAIRREFPILEERVHGKRLVWLDNAATTQKPRAVIDRISYYYAHENSNIHRAAHTLAARATDAYESARETVRRFIRAPSKNDIVFVRGATEGINLVAATWGLANVREGDEIVLTHLEHHANIVPWHRLCQLKGARLRVAPVDDRGQIILDEYEKLLGPKTRLVAMPQVSNALGTVTPAAEMIEMAHRHGAKVLLDGAQAISHMSVDVQALDCDFFVFSGHKVFAPTGIGAVYGKSALLEQMPPYQGGGNMIQDVTFERIVYQGPPARFEAGTGNIADAVGLGAALDWLSRIGVENVGRYEHELLDYATEELRAVPGLTIIGTAPAKAGVISFVLAGQKTEEVGGLLDREGIAVRSGHHCAQPILRRFGLEATVRASLAPYNTCEDIDALVDALMRLQAGHVRR